MLFIRLIETFQSENSRVRTINSLNNGLVIS